MSPSDGGQGTAQSTSRRAINLLGRWLHELDSCAIGVSDIDNTLPSIRAGLERLRFASRFPAGRRNYVQHGIKVIYRERDVHRSDIARPEVNMFSFRWSEVFEQLDLMSVTFEDGDRDLGTGHAGDFTSKVAGVMRPMRKLEAENISPESKRPFEIRNCDPSMIGGDNTKYVRAHVL